MRVVLEERGINTCTMKGDAMREILQTIQKINEKSHINHVHVPQISLSRFAISLHTGHCAVWKLPW